MNKIRTVIFDWAGTIIDHGVFAPIEAIRESFSAFRCTISAEEARGPMGVHKKDHIRLLFADTNIRNRWTTATGRSPTESDVEATYELLLKVQLDHIRRYSRAIDGLGDVFAWLRSREIGIGSTTGYVRAMLDVAEDELKKQGFAVDFAVAADEVVAGRPAAYGCWRIAAELETPRAAWCVKVGDTVPDIEEGLNAGMWSIGVVETGNAVGLGREEVKKLAGYPEADAILAARRQLIDAGAHDAIPGVWALPDAIRRIEERLAAGERP